MFTPKSINSVAQLIIKYLRNDLSDEERTRLEEWASSSEENLSFLRSISSEKIFRIDEDFDPDIIFEKIQAGILVS